MEFRAGSSQDAEAIAGLIASFQSELTDDPSGAGAEEYLASVSVRAEREYLASARYRYLLAYSGALRELCAPSSEGAFTVNSSLSAVPVYQAFGFAPAESLQSAHGISFLPMRRPGSLA